MIVKRVNTYSGIRETSAGHSQNYNNNKPGQSTVWLLEITVEEQNKMYNSFC